MCTSRYFLKKDVIHVHIYPCSCQLGLAWESKASGAAWHLHFIYRRTWLQVLETIGWNKSFLPACTRCTARSVAGLHFAQIRLLAWTSFLLPALQIRRHNSNPPNMQVHLAFKGEWFIACDTQNTPMMNEEMKYNPFGPATMFPPLNQQMVIGTRLVCAVRFRPCVWDGYNEPLVFPATRGEQLPWQTPFDTTWCMWIHTHPFFLAPKWWLTGSYFIFSSISIFFLCVISGLPVILSKSNIIAILYYWLWTVSCSLV